MYTGLTDLDQRGNIVPGIAESWEPNKELTAWTFRLRKGVLFHNGREVDAEAVKLNIMRIKNPAIGGDWERGAVDTIDSVEVLDKYTVRIHASVPDASLPSSVMHYPTRLMAPDAFDTAPEHPIGTDRSSSSPGRAITRPRWCALRTTGRPMPRAIACPTWMRSSANPSRENSVRLTALRTGQVQLINTMAQADIERFKETQGDKYNLWRWTWRRELCGLQLPARAVSGQAPAHRRGACHRPPGPPSRGVLRSRGDGRPALPRGQSLAPGGHPQPGVRSRQGQSPAQGGAGRRHRGQDPLPGDQHHCTARRRK